MGKHIRKRDVKYRGSIEYSGDEQDDDGDIYATYHTSSRVLTVTKVPVPKKKLKVTHVPVATPAVEVEADVGKEEDQGGEEDEEDEKEDVDAEEGKPKQKTGISKFMREYTEDSNFAAFEAAIFSTRSHPLLSSSSPVACACGGAALFRCPECTLSTLVCANCLLQMHPNHRLHHVERWDGAAFVRIKLHDLGHQVHLGHNGAPCRNGPKDDDGGPTLGRDMVIVDTNGVHTTKVFFCHCGIPPKPERFQLAEAALFPATVKFPHTAFTFQVLDNFHVHNLTSKKTARDYYRALQKLTDGAIPQKVPDRYREFSRVVQLWRNFTMM